MLFLPLSLCLSLTLPLLARASPCCRLVAPSASASVQSKAGSTTSGLNPAGSNPDAVLAAAYYPGWVETLTPANVSWGKYNNLLFAFAVTTPTAPFYDLLGEEQNLQQFVSAAHAKNVNATLSVGGWTGSAYFSSLVASGNRSAFVNSMVQLVNTYHLDGLDFDWEYPASTGAGCNQNSPSDASNFLAFLQDLRQQVGSSITITAPVSLKPWIDETGSPMTDVSQFAAVLDNIMIMNYDVWGSWSNAVGPNAPLNDSCAAVADQQGSAVSAVASWTAAGMPPSQIVLGLAAYGHSFSVPNSAALSNNQLVAYPAFDKNNQPLGPQDSNVTTTTSSSSSSDSGGCGGGSTGPSGIFDYADLVNLGWLSTNGTPTAGMDWRFDNCSQTDYIYNPTTQVMVSYDSPEAWSAKGQFINQKNLKGFAVWDVSGDFNDLLLDGVYDGMGLESTCSSD